MPADDIKAEKVVNETADTLEELPTTEFCETIQKHVLALDKIIWIYTHEEKRAVTEITRAIELLRIRPEYTKPVSFTLAEWSLTSGIHAIATPVLDRKSIKADDPPKVVDVDPDETRDPESAVDWVQSYNRDVIAVLKDFHSPLHRAGPTRKLRDFVAHMESTTKTQRSTTKQPAKTIIIISPVIDIPIELQKSVTVLDFALPSEEEIGERIDSIVKTINKSKKKKKADPSQLITPTMQERDDLIKAARGLTLNEMENAIARSLVEFKRPDVHTLREEKAQIVKKNGVLEQMQQVPMNEVGGMDKLKNWLDEGSSGWTEAGRDYGLDSPRGVLLLGVQGCGKSLVSRAIAGMWDLDLYRLDVGKLFNQTIGSSESQTRNVLKTIEGVAPAVLFIDEIDKGLAGVQSSNFSDGGTTARVVGTILTWMNDHNSGIFIVATSNSIESLPPELLRKGRFDEIFFVGLPSFEEREEIARVHIRKIGRNPEDFNIKLLAEKTDKHSGAEIEAIIKKALRKSFPDGLGDTHLLESAEETVPLWKTRQEEIQKLIHWVDYDEERKEGVRAVYASSKREEGGEGDNILSIKKAKGGAE